MPSVVFFRAANVGGHQTFRPSALAKELADLDVVNIGAAGTFVVRTAIGQAKLRAEILRRLPFKPELMICSAREVLDLAAADPFADEAFDDDVRRCVCVLAKRPQKLPPLPYTQPPGDRWQVKLLGIFGRLVPSAYRRLGDKLLYPNEVVEKQLGIPATTRNWDTIAKMCMVLKGK